MIDDLFDSLAEFGIRAGIKLIKEALEEGDQPSPTQVADLILVLAVHSAGNIAERTGFAGRLTFEQFAQIVAMLMGGYAAFFQQLGGVQIELSDASLDFVEKCADRWDDLQQKDSQVSVTSALVKN